MTVQVHKRRVGEELQEQRHASRVHRRLEDKAAAVAAQAELAQEVEEGVCPALARRARRLLEGEVRPKRRLVCHEGQRHVGRGASAQHVDAQLVLLRRIEVEGHLVHGALLGHQPGKQSLERLEPQEGGREGHAEGAAVAKVDIVKRHQRVQKRRAGTWMAEDEDGPRIDALMGDRTSVQQHFDERQQ